jgi:ribosome-associated translation inhibitor RaiA
MPCSDKAHDLRMLFKARQYELSEAEKSKMEEDTRTLQRLVASFPVADLHVEIFRHPRVKDFHVKTTLQLPGRALFTGDRDIKVHPAYERCVRKLVNKVRAYKERMAGKPEQERLAQGVRTSIWPSFEPDESRIRRAVTGGDFAAFREALAVYDEPLEHRVGRLLQRYPRAEALLGREILLSEVVEEVYLNAFERFEDRPKDRLGNWLRRLIAPSIRRLVGHVEQEIEEFRLAKEVLPPGGSLSGLG